MSLEALQERIREAAARGQALRLRGGGTKDFYGGELRGDILDCRPWAGVVDYEPTELVVTARGGTPLLEVEETLRERGQCLPFEPPHFGPGATLGGCVAAGLSGPRRAAAGAVRDFVLGCSIVDGRGRLLAFGGQVMKNVAGYDVSRLVAGSLGTLGVIAQVSLKVLPRPAAERTVRFEMSQAQAIEAFNAWAGQPIPISGTSWHDGRASARLAGSEPAVDAGCRRIGGESVAAEAAAEHWRAVREQTHPFFHGPEALWRLAVPSLAPELDLPGAQLMEWNGALRWLKSTAEPGLVREAARKAGGHATLFRTERRAAAPFAPIAPALLRIHRELKAAFDPAGIFNPGRLHPEL